MEILFDTGRLSISFAEYKDWCGDNDVEPTDRGYFGYCSNLITAERELAVAKLKTSFPGRVAVSSVITDGRNSREITAPYEDLESAVSACEKYGEELERIIRYSDGSVIVEVLRGRIVLVFVLIPGGEFYESFCNKNVSREL